MVLEPLAIAANVTQANHARLDTVLITLGALYWTYSSAEFTEEVRTVVHASLEKRWKAVDQPVYIMAVIMNPYIRMDAFNSRFPLKFHADLWSDFWALYQRVNNIKPGADGKAPAPPPDLRRALGEYVRREGVFTDEKMDLDGRHRGAEQQVCLIICSA
jgi:hypothetical protein